MDNRNQTAVLEFILLPLTSDTYLRLILFILLVLLYICTLIGNILILTMVILDRRLYTPMYIFLGNLSFSDIIFSTATVPSMISSLVTRYSRISLHNCIAQLYFFHFFGCTEALILASMSYDRYVAICSLLRYNVIMTKNSCLKLLSSCWTFGFVYSLTHTILTSLLPFCYLNKVNNFFCDIKPLLKLACADTSLNTILVTVITGFIALSTFLIISLSYILIGKHLLKMISFQERKKAFSACTSHVFVVILYYGPGFSRYLRPIGKDTLEQDRWTAVVHTIFTPLLNPVIYTLRNQEFKQSFKTIFMKKRGISI